MMLNERRPPSLAVQLVDLLLIELTNWRWSWRQSIITSVIAPVFSMAALGVFARSAGPEALAYVLSGNLVLSLMFGMLDRVQSHVIFMRMSGTLDYFAALPVRRSVSIVAIVIAFLLLTLPSLIITLLLGAVVLDVPLHLSPALLVVIPLCGLTLAGIGAVIGVWTRNPQDAGSLSLVLTLVLMSLGPVVVPPERIPPLLRTLGVFSPATYAASAMRQALLGPMTSRILLDLGVLAILAVALLWLASRRLDWRQR